MSGNSNPRADRDAAMRRLTTLHAKQLAGYHDGSFIAHAEALADYRLRPQLIAELTGIHLTACRRIAKSRGPLRVGRRKTSVEEIFFAAEAQMRTSLFLVNIEKLMKLNRAADVLSSHVLDAIRATFALSPETLRTADWERLAEAAQAWHKGYLQLTTCASCYTRHVVPGAEIEFGARKPWDGDRSCPLCRVSEAAASKRVTGHQGGLETQRFVKQTGKIMVPRKVAVDRHERNARLKTITDAEPLADLEVVNG